MLCTGSECCVQVVSAAYKFGILMFFYSLQELEKMKVDYFEVKSSLWKKEQCIKELKICLEVIKGSEQQLAVSEHTPLTYGRGLS